MPDGPCFRVPPFREGPPPPEPRHPAGTTASEEGSSLAENSTEVQKTLGRVRAPARPAPHEQDTPQPSLGSSLGRSHKQLRQAGRACAGDPLSAPCWRGQRTPDQGQGPSRPCPTRVSAQPAHHGACVSRGLEPGSEWLGKHTLPRLREGQALRAHLGSRRESPPPQGCVTDPGPRIQTSLPVGPDGGWGFGGRARCRLSMDGVFLVS